MAAAGHARGGDGLVTLFGGAGEGVIAPTAGAASAANVRSVILYPGRRN